MRLSLIAILLTARAFPATTLLSIMYRGKEKVRRYLPSDRSNKKQTLETETV